jgi:hypothetical protein
VLDRHPAERYRAAYGFARATDDWLVLVQDPRRRLLSRRHNQPPRDCRAALPGKPVLCEKTYELI